VVTHCYSGIVTTDVNSWMLFWSYIFWFKHPH